MKITFLDPTVTMYVLWLISIKNNKGVLNSTKKLYRIHPIYSIGLKRPSMSLSTARIGQWGNFLMCLTIIMLIYIRIRNGI